MKYLIVGLIGGIVGGMGMGGGTLLIPMLTLFLGVEQKTAQLMNIISFIPMGIMTIILHSKDKLIKWKYVLYVGVSSCIAAIISSFMVRHIEGKVLKICFGVFLIVLGIAFLVSLIVKEIKRRKGETLTRINVLPPKED